MKSRNAQKRKYDRLLISVSLLVLVFQLGPAAPVAASPIDITDDTGVRLKLKGPPKRVVSLVPSSTEIIFAINVGDALVGITHHSTAMVGAAKKRVVGGFAHPSVKRILALKPDLVIISSYHKKVAATLKGKVPVLVMNTLKMDDAFRHIEMMGILFRRDKAAADLIRKNREQLELIARKTAQIPPNKRRRVMRMMGRGGLMTPGRDSFQNEIIRAAGGLPPGFQVKGGAVLVSRKQFVRFNPQFIYGCGGDREMSKTVLTKRGWKRVAAVKNRRIRMFPCELTCRASVHLGYFVSWLSSEIYADFYVKANAEVLPRKVTSTRPVKIDLDYVENAEVASVTLHDFKNKSLIINFNAPQSVVSTLEGQRSGIRTVGNHYSPPSCWTLNHESGLKGLHDLLYPILGVSRANASFLFTGANMDNLAVIKQRYKAMTVYGLVTAGVRGNAVRMGTDTGDYYEPGTINMIFLTNMRLSPRAMTRAIIAATEGKSAALQDLEIRSSYQPLTAAATGTGTDNIIVVQGQGTPIDNAGGHTKMGELIARAAYSGVRESIRRQNGIVSPRDVFQRLKERHLTVSQLLSNVRCDCDRTEHELIGDVEQILIDPQYSGFIEASLALSDGHKRGTFGDLSLFEIWCRQTASRIAGRKIDVIKDHLADKDLPKPLAMALNAVLTGVIGK